MEVKGRVALVTGAASGIGKAYAIELLSQGAKVKLFKTIFVYVAIFYLCIFFALQRYSILLLREMKAWCLSWKFLGFSCHRQIFIDIVSRASSSYYYYHYHHHHHRYYYYYFGEERGSTIKAIFRIFKWRWSLLLWLGISRKKETFRGSFDAISFKTVYI